MHFPSDNFTAAECHVIHRPDLSGRSLPNRISKDQAYNGNNDDKISDEKDNDGLVHVCRANQMLFPKDQRLKEVARLVRSCKIMVLHVANDTGRTDTDLVSPQQQRLLLLCKRSMALSVARGMITLNSVPVRTQPFTSRLLVPPLPLIARLAGTNTKVHNQHILQEGLRHLATTGHQWLQRIDALAAIP